MATILSQHHLVWAWLNTFHPSGLALPSRASNESSEFNQVIQAAKKAFYLVLILEGTGSDRVTPCDLYSDSQPPIASTSLPYAGPRQAYQEGTVVH
ncbi:hypothetical protein BJX68DRAFT_267767 [Aspergillus pseudodeflectus]|uniref:Uncharacterized protein n=1 Tax=Aspergillus pseudodeflectus TaxID=176178 RepID=A0ABR4K7P5_9EURO